MLYGQKKDEHVFRKLNARGKVFIEYEPIKTARTPIIGYNYIYVYCLWVAGSFKENGIAKVLLEFTIFEAKKREMSVIYTVVSKKKKTFIGEKIFEYFGFKLVDKVQEYELLALQFYDGKPPKFTDKSKKM